MKRYPSILAAAFSLVLTYSGSSEANEPEYAVFVKSRDGIVVVWNESDAHFTIELLGDNIEPSNMGGVAFMLDGRLLQVVTSDPSEYATSADTPDAVLEHHMKWEVAHWESMIEHPMPANVIHTETALPSDMLMWELRWPKKVRKKLSVKTITNVFATATVGNRVVSISHPVMKGQSEAEAHEYVERVARTLKRHTGTISVLDVRRAVMNRE